MYISRMEIGRTRRDALELYRSFGRFIDDDEYHIPAVRQCDSAFCCGKGKSKYTEVIVLLSLRYASAKHRSLLDRDAKIGLMMRYNSSSKFTSDIFIQRNVADTSINAEEFLREGRHYIKLDLYLTLVP